MRLEAQWFKDYTAGSSVIPFALDDQGRIRDVEEVERGLSCACFCPECEGPLVARKGDIRAHHFAHHDRAKCRHALESSLFLMAMDILTQPKATVMLPSWGNRQAWVDRAGLDVTLPKVQKFLAPEWVIPSKQLQTDIPATQNVSTAKKGSWDTPDIVFPAANIALHLLTHRKRYVDQPAVVDLNHGVPVAINLSFYTNLWWGDVCDEDRDARMIEAMSAREIMSDWLANQTSGRGWLTHPEGQIRKHKFQTWAARVKAGEQERQLAEKRAQQIRKEEEARRWTIPNPTKPLSPNERLFRKAIQEKVARLPVHLPSDLGMIKPALSLHWGWAGNPGSIVPDNVRNLLDEDSPWEPVILTEATTSTKAAPVRHSVEMILREVAKPKPSRKFEPICVVVKKDVGICSRCKAPTHWIRHDNGFFAGKTVETCSANPKHPVILVT